MMLETFFEKFELFAEAPGAVAKMRELILESAIRGNLVPQNESDEPASELLKRIASVQSGQLRKQVALPPVGRDAYLQTPPGWAWTRLGNTGRIFNGDSVSESGKAELARVEHGLPFIATKDVGYGCDRLAYDNGLKVPPRDPRFKMARANAVLICAEGGSAGRKIGITDRDICFGNKLYANEVLEGIHHRYIFYVYLATTFFKEFAAKMTGIIGGISRSEFLSLPIPLPPEKEQKRIVAKVDELMALCDRLEAQQQERQTRHTALTRASLSRFVEAPTPANLDFLFHDAYAISPAELRKSFLTLAVQGKLVSQDPNDESAQRSFPGLKPLNSESSDSNDTPDQWEWCAYRSLTSLVTSGSRGWKEFYSKSGAIFIRTQNIKTDRLVLHDVAFVDLPNSAEGMRAQVMKGDILVTITGANVTKAARVEEQIPEAYISQHIALSRPLWSEMSRWIHLCFISHGSARGALEELAYGDKPGLNLNNIRDLVLPVPPLAEQRRIVAKVDQLMALVDHLEEQLSAAKAVGTELLDAAIHELLNPKVVEPLLLRVAVGCQIVQKMADKRYFGRTANMKALYLAQAHIGIDLGIHPVREAAGPFDPWVYQFEKQAANEHWFDTIESETGNSNKKVEYRPGAALSAQAACATAWLTPTQCAELDRLLGLLADKTTEKVEIIATLFAAWNDALIDGLTPSDDDVVREVHNNWNVSKQRFTPSVLKTWLDWLRDNQLVPRGLPPRTSHQQQLLPN